MKYSVLVLALALIGPSAKADLIQVCVDSKSGVYTAAVSHIAKAGESFDGTLTHKQPATLANGTRLASLQISGSLDDANEGTVLEGLYYDLKHQLAQIDELTSEAVFHGDEPRAYKSGDLTLLCSSTINTSDLKDVPR